jgi:hypothetical protein
VPEDPPAELLYVEDIRFVRVLAPENAVLPPAGDSKLA